MEGRWKVGSFWNSWMVGFTPYQLNQSLLGVRFEHKQYLKPAGWLQCTAMFKNQWSNPLPALNFSDDLIPWESALPTSVIQFSLHLHPSSAFPPLQLRKSSSASHRPPSSCHIVFAPFHRNLFMGFFFAGGCHFFASKSLFNHLYLTFIPIRLPKWFLSLLIAMLPNPRVSFLPSFYLSAAWPLSTRYCHFLTSRIPYGCFSSPFIAFFHLFSLHYLTSRWHFPRAWS